jgi:hypothetical protein
LGIGQKNYCVEKGHQFEFDTTAGHRLRFLDLDQLMSETGDRQMEKMPEGYNDRSCGTLEARLESMVLLNATYLRTIRSLEKENAFLRFQVKEHKYVIKIWKIMSQSIRKPGMNTVKMPFRIIKQLIDWLR